jgi:hypothetical protein
MKLRIEKCLTGNKKVQILFLKGVNNLFLYVKCWKQFLFLFFCGFLNDTDKKKFQSHRVDASYYIENKSSLEKKTPDIYLINTFLKFFFHRSLQKIYESKNKALIK